MRQNNSIALFFLLSIFALLSAGVVAAQENSIPPMQGYGQQPMPSQQPYAQSSQYGTALDTRGFDLGMPEWSSAAPEYVAEQKMTESMTTAYNWIALNTARFADGCKTDKASLTSEISSVIQQAQETSSVCQRFDVEAKSCNPEIFCSRFSSGSLPLPPDARVALKRLGYNPDTIKISDITQEMIIKICMSSNESEISTRKQMLESTKEQIRQQLSGFRQKCEQLKQQRSGPGIRLPDFDINPMRQGPGINYNQQPKQPVQQMPPQNYDTIQQPQTYCNTAPPNCSPQPPPYCQNGNWICPEMPQQQTTIQEPVETVPQQTITEPLPPATTETTEPAPTTTTEQQTITEPVPAPAPEPAPVESNGGRETVQTIESNQYVSIIKNMITGFAGFEGQDDYATGQWYGDYYGQGMPENVGAGGAPGMDYGGRGDQGNYYGNSPYGGTGMGGGYQQQNQQINRGPSGPSPETLCSMTDEELIESYTSQMQTGMPSDEEMRYRCSMESGRMLQEMNRYKLEIARCRADAALDCQAKQQALQSCNEMKDNPEKVASLVVNNMCRRFGTTTATAAQNKLFGIASKWYEADPALANQLGDTAEKTIEDQKNLDALSYFFGNGDYGKKLSERAKKLQEVKERLASKGITDQETISTLESQISDLETEGSKFNNPLDITRLGYIFRTNK